jgi:cytochrome c-type biogenesis protein CcmH/NrfG
MAELRTERAICKMALKDNAGALTDLQTAVQRDATFALAHYYLGGRLAEQRKAKEAAAEYEQYLKLAPNGPMAKAASERLKVLKQVR